MLRSASWAVIALTFVTAIVVSVDKSNFKKCADSSFCKRHTTDRESGADAPEYAVLPESVMIIESQSSSHQDPTHVTFDIQNTRDDSLLYAKIFGFVDQTVRFIIDEKHPLHERHRVQDVVEEDLQPAKIVNLEKKTSDEHPVTAVTYDNGVSVIVSYQPFRVDFLRDQTIVGTINSRNLLNFERYRERREDETWEEMFKTHKDTRQKGPSAVSFDFTFNDADYVYGIPEHADSLSLRDTTDNEPYRLYNLDVFEYELDNTMALYGSIPYMVAHSKTHTAGLLFLNSAEMWIHTSRSSHSSTQTRLMRVIRSLFSSTPNDSEEKQLRSIQTQWIAESGIIDVFVFLGSRPTDVFRQYARVTGTVELPPLFSIAYHQCRWNYNDQDDVLYVDQHLDTANIPTDVIWLDIEHTDGKRYMTWDKAKFADPKAMQDFLNVKGRKMVNIVDPHIKRTSGYRIHDEASSLGLYIKDRDGNDYDGWCWPGSSSWLDFMDPQVRDWWADQFVIEKYQGTSQSMYFWNDMNEPSVFNGPEVTMHKDAIHFQGWEHRDVHNIYGMWQQASTAEGIRRRSGGTERPFVLSRAFFSGSQKYGAIWTGDNTADWAHLEASIPMLLSIGVAGLPFCGADIGGFFGNPSTELLVRWYQAGAFQPFMRAHAHLDTKRREPYLLDENEQDIVRNAIRKRYQLLPYWYLQFYLSSRDGAPVMRPLWVEYPEEEGCFTEQHTYLVGKDLLVSPVTASGVTSVRVYFPGLEPWYDIETGFMHNDHGEKTVSAPLRKIPVFQRGGSIIPQKLRVRRTSSLMTHDPFTLVAALDGSGAANGLLYADDYHTYAYRDGNFLLRTLEIETDGNSLIFRSRAHFDSGKLVTQEWVERIRIYGVANQPKSITSSFNDKKTAALDFTFDVIAKMLDIKKPSTRSISEDFTVIVTF